MKKTRCFDPARQDDICDDRVFAIPLVLPCQTEFINRIRVKKKW